MITFQRFRNAALIAAIEPSEKREFGSFASFIAPCVLMELTAEWGEFSKQILHITSMSLMIRGILAHSD